MVNWLKIIIILLIVISAANAFKLVIKQPRPETATLTDYGMPNTHTAFAAAFIPLFGLNIFTGGFVIIMGIQRILSGQHTLLQVLIGGLLGYGLAYILNKVMD